MSKHQSYRELKQKLDEILEKMQDPTTDLDTALQLHEEGKKILSLLQEYLKEVDSKISKASK